MSASTSATAEARRRMIDAGGAVGVYPDLGVKE
jgi:hypothetical protein